MKILFIAPLSSPHSQRWIQFFANKGYDVHCISFIETTLPLKNVKTHILAPLKNTFFRTLLSPFFILRVRKTIKQIHPDIVHIHQIIPIYRFIFTGLPYPTIATPWGSDVLIKPQKNLFIRWNLAYFLKCCRLLICDADHMKRALIDLGAQERNIEIIFFGTNLVNFNPSKKDQEFRNKITGDNNTKLIASLRQLYPIYDIPTFIQAMPLVLNIFPKSCFLIISDGPEKENLIKLAKSLNVFKNIRFLGRISDDDLPTVLASIDIYVSTSLSDGGLAASTAEAMASQVPVVISDFGENKTWVEEGINGLLFPLRDHQKLAEKIIYLLSNPMQAQQIAENGRKVIAIRNNYYIEMGKVDLLYQGLTALHSRRNATP